MAQSPIRKVAQRLGQHVQAKTDRLVGKVPDHLPIAAMTMCWNEETYLRKWVQYYGDQFGRENLYVLAHGGEDVVHDVAQGCVIYDLPRRVVDGTRDRRRTRLIEGFFNFLLGDHRAIIFGDVDEFIVADPDVGELGTIIDSNFGKHPSLKSFNLNVLDAPGAPDIDFSQSVFAQRRHAHTRFQFCKPVILYEPANFVGGFHYSTHPPHIEEGLYLSHIHYADRATNEQIAEARLNTFADQPGLTTAPARNRNAWENYMKRFYDYNGRTADLPVVPLDEIVPKLIRAMRSNVVDGHDERPGLGQTMTFGKAKTDFRIEVPERFAKVF